MLREKETYKYLGISEADTIRQVEMKKTTTKKNKKQKKKTKKKEYLKNLRKLLETYLYSRNLINGINTWVVPLVRYSGLFLRRTLTNGL